MYFIIGFKYILFVVLSQPKSKISATCFLNVKVVQSSVLDPLLFSIFSVPQVTSPNLVPPNVAFHVFICKPDFVTWCMGGISTFCLSGHVRIAMPTQKSWLVVPQLYPHSLPAFSPGNPRPHTLSSVNIFTWIPRRQGFCPSIPCSLSFWICSCDHFLSIVLSISFWKKKILVVRFPRLILEFSTFPVFRFENHNSTFLVG